MQPTNSPAGSYRRYADLTPVAKGIQAEDVKILALATKMQPELIQAILEWLDAQRSAVDVMQIADMLMKGDTEGILSLISAAGTDGAAIMQNGLHKIATAAGTTIGVAQVSQIGGAQIVFGALNRRLLDWLHSYSLGQIRQVNAGTVEAIRSYLAQGMTAGANPRDVAVGLKQVIGLTTRQMQAVVNFNKQLKTFHTRTGAAGWNLGAKISRAPGGAQVYAVDESGHPLDGILERRLRDFRYDGQLSKAMATGKPLTPEQITKMTDAYARKYLKYRAQTIARTEALRATNFGVQDAWRQAIAAGKVPEKQTRRLWVVAKNERVCKICSAIPSMNPKRGVEFGASFATPAGPMFIPPAHPDCVCTTVVRVWEPSQLAG